MKRRTLLTIAVSAALLVLITGCGNKEEIVGTIESGTVSSTIDSFDDGTAVSVTNVNLSEDGYFKDIIKSGDNPEVKSTVVYDTDWQDKTWDDIDFSISKVKVVEVDKYKDKNDNVYKGLISMKYTLKNNGSEEVSIKPDDAKVVLEDGTEIKATHFFDYWEDIFELDKQKDGYLYFALDKADEINQIKEIKINFDGKTTGNQSDKIGHTYDVTLPLT